MSTIQTFTWGHDALRVVLGHGTDLAVSLLAVTDPAQSADQVPESFVVADRPVSVGGYRPSVVQPLVEVSVRGHGRARASERVVETAVGARLRYVGHEVGFQDGWHELTVRQQDPLTGMGAVTLFRSADGVPAVEVVTTVENTSSSTLVVEMVTTAVLTVAAVPVAGARLELLEGRSEWLGEDRWTRRDLTEHSIVDLDFALHGQDPRGRYTVAGQSTWSTSRHLPCAALVETRADGSRRTTAWEVHNNGPWRWELGARETDGIYLALLGPDDEHHHFAAALAPGDRFASVPVALAVAGGDFEQAVAALTSHRRALRSERGAVGCPPVVFNDYMNTINGDPTTDRLLPLIASAAEVGADVFCIDAGWYDDGNDWWNTIGDWLPSTRRFPRGIDEVLGAIRDAGMIPGLWLEPESVGCDSALAARLPADAFIQRGGVRVVEQSRLHLDFRHPAVRAHLDGVIDRVVGELGVGYLKFDYNIPAGVGTDVAAFSPGAGLLDHARAVLSWMESVHRRHPDLIVESCASGAMRKDYATLQHFALQSTSDQQDLFRYPPIASASLVTVVPEQAGNWAYPQSSMTTEEMAFTLVTGLVGPMVLSGYLNRMSAAQRALVAEAVVLAKDTFAMRSRAVPLWPTGLPRWDDPFVSVALAEGDEVLVFCWERSQYLGETYPAELGLDLAGFAGRSARVETVFPLTTPEWKARWLADEGVLAVQPTAEGREAPSARVLRVVFE
ncbi:glycoside hydrolase family 36 protein [Actinotalea sp.]|uniref:glycoside hydrolase family 36 protein n=1 Tax=Actinotalea sp. TaxID=1872145 RepID=UPI00356258D5